MGVNENVSGRSETVSGELSGCVVISGGLGGLGQATAREVLRRGADVVLLGRRTRAEVSDRLEEIGPRERVHYREHDATDPASAAAMFNGLTGVSGLVANAAIFRGAPVLEMDTQDFKEVLEVNVSGTFYLAQAAARHLVGQGRGGSIVMISSWAQNVPDYGSVAYCTSKGGLRMMARTMALELGAHGIRVNVLAPGIVDAGMAQRQLSTDAAYAGRARRTVPLDRFQTAKEVAAATAFLLSPDASYITGADLLADGGASLFRREV